MRQIVIKQASGAVSATVSAPDRRIAQPAEVTLRPRSALGWLPATVDHTPGTVSREGEDGAMARSTQTFESLVATRVELLIDALGTATRVAECLGVTRPLLSKWRAGTVMPTPAQAKLLVDLDHVVARGSLIYVPEIVNEWLFGHDSYLEGARPIDVLHLRGVADVLAALDSLEQAAWGG